MVNKIVFFSANSCYSFLGVKQPNLRWEFKKRKQSRKKERKHALEKERFKKNDNDQDKKRRKEIENAN